MTSDRRRAAVTCACTAVVLTFASRPIPAGSTGTDGPAPVYRAAGTLRPPTDDTAAPALATAWPELEWSDCLATAAATVAERTTGSQAVQLPDGLLRDVTAWAGCPDPSPTALTLDTSESSLVDITGELRRLRSRADEPFTHAGVARTAIDRGRYRWRWVVVLAVRRVELTDDVPRRHAPGDVVPIRLRLDSGLSTPSLVVARPDGSLQRQLLVEDDGRWWTLVHVGPAEGTVNAQLMADARTGPSVVASLELWVGAPPTTLVDVVPSTTDRSDLGFGERARAWMVDRINALRRDVEAPALVRDPLLDLVATAHSEDMRRHRFVGHRSPTRGDLPERLDAAGIDYRAARENISWAADVEAALRELQRSPSHRGNLLAHGVDRVGIGMVATPDGAPGRRLLVTQIFTGSLPTIDPQQILTAASAPVRPMRERRGLPPVRRCGELDLAAAALAEEPYATALDADTSFVRVRDALEPRSERWGSLKLAVVRVSEPREVEPPTILRWDDAVAWGVAVRHLPLEGLPEYQVVWVASADLPWRACD